MASRKRDGGTLGGWFVGKFKFSESADSRLNKRNGGTEESEMENESKFLFLYSSVPPFLLFNNFSVDLCESSFRFPLTSRRLLLLFPRIKRLTLDLIE